MPRGAGRGARTVSYQAQGAEGRAFRLPRWHPIIVLAVGFVGYDTVHHFMLDRDFYGRIDELSDRPHP